MDDENYVVVTAISSHRMRYCIPVSDLHKLNKDSNPDGVEVLEWARDEVTMQNVEEFSQEWLGEQIVDATLLDEEEMLQMFERDNAYLKDWPREQKLQHVRNWKHTIGV